MINVDGGRFEELAERLKTTPEVVVNAFLDSLHNPPQCITTHAMNSGFPEKLNGCSDKQF